MRIGQGRDIHRLVSGRDLVIGGVKIPHSKGCEAHSDGDVLYHALIDAILGALSLGDIGQHFPDTDSSFKDIDSRILLRKVNELLDESSFKVVNIDSTVSLEIPKLKNYIPLMISNIAEDLKIEKKQVSVKAKTNERLDSIGNDEAVGADVVLLLE